MGPMTGYMELNWPAFDAARDQLSSEGWEAISPADIDRNLGVTPSDVITPEKLQELFREDVIAILTCEAIFALPGWTRSVGSAIEYQLGRAIGCRIYDYETRQLITPDWFTLPQMWQHQNLFPGITKFHNAHA